MPSKWQHPTGKSPKVITLVCLGHSRDSYISAALEPDLSDAVLGVDEVWTLNRGVTPFRHDLLFVMDHIQGEAEANPHYGVQLWRHDKPIITSDNAEGWPSHVHLYPWAEIQHWLADVVKPNHGEWFVNSLAFILVYAAYIGGREIRVFGADYTNHSSGVVEDGHPNVAYWVGALERVGLCVKMPTSSGFLNANQRSWLYGYRSDPRGLQARRKQFQELIRGAGDELWSGERQVSPTMEGIRADHRLRYEWVAKGIFGEVIDLGGGIGYGSAILANNRQVSAVYMFDRSAAAIEYAKAYYAHPRVDLFCQDLDGKALDIGLTSITDYADYAVAFEIIEHLSDPVPLLKTLPAKNLFASVPNEAAMPYSPESAPFHYRHYTQEQLERLLIDCGWFVTGWYGQLGIDSPVDDYGPACRTIIVEAERRGPIHPLAGT